MLRPAFVLRALLVTAVLCLAALTAGRDARPTVRTVLDAGEPRNPYFPQDPRGPRERKAT